MKKFHVIFVIAKLYQKLSAYTLKRIFFIELMKLKLSLMYEACLVHNATCVIISAV